jgi:hypothetical protein
MLVCWTFSIISGIINVHHIPVCIIQVLHSAHWRMLHEVSDRQIMVTMYLFNEREMHIPSERKIYFTKHIVYVWKQKKYVAYEITVWRQFRLQLKKEIWNIRMRDGLTST